MATPPSEPTRAGPPCAPMLAWAGDRMPRVSPLTAGLWLVLALAMALFMSQIADLLRLPDAPAAPAHRLREGGDSFGHWFALQALRQGDTPYADAVTRATQIAIWGQPAPAGVQAYAYPLPALVWYLPLAWLPFESTAAYARLLGLVGLGASLLLLAGLFGFWGYVAGRVWGLLALAGLLGSHAGVYDQWLLGQATSVSLAVMLAIVLCYRAGYYTLAGSLAPLLALKPQYTPIILIGLTVHALASAQRRRFLGAAAISTGLVALVSAALDPSWVSGWLRNLAAYQYQSPLLSVVVGDDAVSQWLARAVLVGIPVAWWWRHRAASPQEGWFVPACLGAVACGMLAFSGNPSPYNMIMAWPVLALAVFGGEPVGRYDRLVRPLLRALAVATPLCAGLIVISQAWLPRSPAVAIGAGTILWLGLALGVLAALWLAGGWLGTLVGERSARGA